MSARDLLWNQLTDDERELLRIYEALKILAEKTDTPPCVSSNVRKALACMWQATNDLNLQFEQLYHLGA
jgi:hypothetical protein